MIHDTQSAQISQKQDEYDIYAIMETICPSCYHHNEFVATHTFGHLMYSYTFLVPTNQTVLKKQSKERNRSSRMHSLVHWYQQCATVHHVSKRMSCHKVIVVITRRAHCFHDCIYITHILILQDLSTLCVYNKP